MKTGTPVAASLTTTLNGDPAIYVSVKDDADGHVYGTTFTLTSEAARALSKKVLAYLGYNSSEDKDYSKIISGNGSVETTKTLEFDLKEVLANDGKVYKNLVFPMLNGVTGKPKNMLTKENAMMLIASHNLKDFFSSVKSEVVTDSIPF